MVKPKGYSKDKRRGTYVVRKYRNGKVMHFGTLPTEEEAIRYVKALEKVDYQIELLPEKFKKYIPERIGEPKFYHYDKSYGKWVVSKTIHGLNTYFGGYDTEQEAQRVVSELKKHNWNAHEVGEIWIGNKKIILKKQSNISKKFVKTSHGKHISEYNPGSLTNPRYDTGDELNVGSLEGTYKKLQKEKESLFQ